MSFSFGLFRFLTYGNLFVVGFLLLLVLMAMLMMPNMSAAVISLMLMGVVFCHNILCLHLQKAVKDPEVEISNNFYTFIIILGVLCLIYCVMVFANVVMMMSVSEAEFAKMMDTQKMQGGEKITPAMIGTIRKISFSLVGIHGLAIAVNCILAFIFLKRWKKQLAERETLTIDQ